VQRGREVDNAIRTFGTTTDEFVELFDWLAAADVTDGRAGMIATS